MSHMVVGPFILLIIPGALLLILGKSNNPTATQRKKLRWGGICLGIGFAYFGIAMIVGTKVSARPEVTGVVEGLRQFNGSRHQSSEFKVSFSDGQTATLSSSYTGSELKEGETVFVRYLEFDHSILYLKILDGPNAGWTLQMSDGWWYGLIFLALAGMSFWTAYSCGRIAS